MRYVLDMLRTGHSIQMPALLIYYECHTHYALLLWSTGARSTIGTQSTCDKPFSLVTRASLRTGQIWATQISF